MTTQKATPDQQTTTRLRQLIASAISVHKSYTVPGNVPVTASRTGRTKKHSAANLNM